MAAEIVYASLDYHGYLQITSVKPPLGVGYFRIVATKHGDIKVFNQDDEEIDPSTQRVLNKTMAFEFETHSTAYSVDVPREDFLALLEYEQQHREEKSLCENLGAITGVFDIEYEGHFGSRVFFTIDVENDNEDTRVKIVSEIQEALRRATKK